MKIKSWILNWLLPHKLYVVRYKYHGDFCHSVFFDRDSELLWVARFTELGGEVVERTTLSLFP